MLERTWIGRRGVELEAVLGYGPGSRARLGVLIVGPHPLLGGNMDNNVVGALRCGLAGDGVVTLSFNYAGVGGSAGGPADWPEAVSAFWRDGRIDEEDGWRTDAATALKFLSDEMGCGPIVVIGYSFGCLAAAGCLADEAVAGAVFVSPNPERHDFGDLDGRQGPLLVIASGNDFSCSEASLRQWYNGLGGCKQLTMIEASEHFFRKSEDEVVERVRLFIAELNGRQGGRIGAQADDRSACGGGPTGGGVHG